MSTASPWKRPDEIMQLHRLKKKKKALQKRMCQSSSNEEPNSSSSRINNEANFSALMGGEKRKNPFSKQKSEEKRARTDSASVLDESSDATLFALLNMSRANPAPAEQPHAHRLASFSNMLHNYTRQQCLEPELEVKHKYSPIDWALKTKVRLMSPKPFAWNLKLKASEEASGITGFVRCVDTDAPNSLDTSPHARFHQHCQYWQHPHLPWLSLFPRTSGRVSGTSALVTDAGVMSALRLDWTESFRSLFQLVRSRQCPYFYVCANSLTCLFRAAGLGGQAETSAMLVPTSSGFRRALRHQDVEFTMPLRSKKRKFSNSNNREEDRPKDSSPDSCYDTMDDDRDNRYDHNQLKSENVEDGSGGEDDYESDQFLTRLGFQTEQIKKINCTQARASRATESAVDSAAESLVLVRGTDAQALFNLLLNCKSMTTSTGPLGGVPPTLLAPTAFHGGTLKSLKVRDSTIVSEDKKYWSVELHGPVLPSALHALVRLLRATAPTFSATFAHLHSTEAFSTAATATGTCEESATSAPPAFSRENLSDCGLSRAALLQFCSADPRLVHCFDSLKYSNEDDSFVWC